MGAIRYLLHEEPSVRIPQLDYALGRAFVKIATYSHLTQTYEFSDFDAGPGGAPPPITSRVIRWEHLVNDMNNAGLHLEHIDAEKHGFVNVHGYMNAIRGRRKPRQECDRCLWRKLNNPRMSGSVNCTPAGDGSSTCHDCKRIFGMPCSYTKDFPLDNAAKADNLVGRFKRQFEALFRKVKSVQPCPEIAPPDFSSDMD